MNRFYAPDTTDRRMITTLTELENMGYEYTNDENSADFVLLSLSDRDNEKYKEKAIYYFDDEDYLIKNAFLTAEIAVGISIMNTCSSLINSEILILGYGRIAKALEKYLSPYTNKITVCARKESDRAYARGNNSDTISFDELDDISRFDYIFNTVDFPVLSRDELKSAKKSCVLIELASLPGGIDKHFARLNKLQLIEARGLPGRFAPERAGVLIAQTVDKIIKGGRI